MVTTLARNGVKYIHSFDVALRQRPQGAVSHPNIGGNFGGWIEDYQLPKGVLFVVSEWGKSYADVDVVGAHLTTNPRGSQATLHWYYDSRKKNYAQLYEDFSDVISRSRARVLIATFSLVDLARASSVHYLCFKRERYRHRSRAARFVDGVVVLCARDSSSHRRGETNEAFDFETMRESRVASPKTKMNRRARTKNERHASQR